MTRRVVCAALLHRTTGVVICGPRHFDVIMRQQIVKVGGQWRDAVQGFVDQNGVFLDRRSAWTVAQQAGQIVRRVGGDGTKLFSENLY